MKSLEINEFEIKVYHRRWFVLFLLIWLLLVQTFTCLNFGLMNIILVDYFQTTYSAVDWMVLGNYVGAFVAAPFVGWLALKKILSCRRAMISAGVLEGLNLILIITGFLQPDLFGVVVLGQTFGGLANAIIWTVPSSLVQLWFKESQIGLATGLSAVGMSAGAITAYILPSQVILPPKVTNTANVTDPTGIGWFRCDKLTYQGIFSALLVSVICVVLVLVVFVPEQPDKPPSEAQRQKRVQQTHENTSNFFTKVKKLATDATFIGCAVASGTMLNILLLIDLTIELILQRFYLASNDHFHEKLAAYVLTSLGVGCWIGNITAGLLLDKFKKYRLQSSLGAGTCFLMSIGFLLSIYFKIFSLFVIFILLLGASMKIGYISLIDSLMQHTYPMEPVFVMSILTFIGNTAAVVFGEGGRQIIYHAGLFAGLSYLSSMLLLALILGVYFNPVTNRLAAEINDTNEKPTQATPLLSK